MLGFFFIFSKGICESMISLSFGILNKLWVSTSNLLPAGQNWPIYLLCLAFPFLLVWNPLDEHVHYTSRSKSPCLIPGSLTNFPNLLGCCTQMSFQPTICRLMYQPMMYHFLSLFHLILPQNLPSLINFLNFFLLLLLNTRLISSHLSTQLPLATALPLLPTVWVL